MFIGVFIVGCTASFVSFRTTFLLPQKNHPEKADVFGKARSTRKNKRSQEFSAKLLKRAIKRAITMSKPTTQKNFEEKLLKFITTKTVPLDVVEGEEFTGLFEGKVNTNSHDRKCSVL